MQVVEQVLVLIGYSKAGITNYNFSIESRHRGAIAGWQACRISTNAIHVNAIVAGRTVLAAHRIVRL